MNICLKLNIINYY